MNVPPALFRVHDVTLGYGGNPVLRRVCLAILPGDFFFFLGPNGTGKTTLLHALLGLLHPQRGTLEGPPAAATALVPQRCDPNPALRTTVAEFAATGFVGLRLTRRERAERLAWALDQVGLTALAGEDYASLSGGQRQRALVARALVRRPQAFLVDEPTAGLDPATQTQLLQLFAAAVHREGRAVVCVTHDVALAQRYATRVALFHDGTVTVGRPDDILAAPRLRRIYGSLPPACDTLTSSPDGSGP